MPEVISGSMPGKSVNDILMTMADLLGYNVGNLRFQNAAKRWITDAIQEIQLKDPQNRRTTVHDATFKTNANQAIYDVALPVADGGFGWENVHELRELVIPLISSRPLDKLPLNVWRDRAYLEEHSGPPYAFVVLDYRRIRLVPIPEQEYDGVGDYFQNYPDITSAGDGFMSWPRSWDAVLMASVKWRGKEWQYADQPSAWKPSHDIYLRLLSDMRNNERSSADRPKKAIQTRYLRSRRWLHSNDVDFRRGRR